MGGGGEGRKEDMQTDKQTNKQRERQSRQTRDIITETEISSSHLFAVPILVLWVELKKEKKRKKSE
jgi:delta-aminolevulinic acid dehydratase/porphobilinogen synthase